MALLPSSADETLSIEHVFVPAPSVCEAMHKENYAIIHATIKPFFGGTNAFRVKLTGMMSQPRPSDLNTRLCMLYNKDFSATSIDGVVGYTLVYSRDPKLAAAHIELKSSSTNIQNLEKIKVTINKVIADALSRHGSSWSTSTPQSHIMAITGAAKYPIIRTIPVTSANPASPDTTPQASIVEPPPTTTPVTAEESMPNAVTSDMPESIDVDVALTSAHWLRLCDDARALDEKHAKAAKDASAGEAQVIAAYDKAVAFLKSVGQLGLNPFHVAKHAWSDATWACLVRTRALFRIKAPTGENLLHALLGHFRGMYHLKRIHAQCEAQGDEPKLAKLLLSLNNLSVTYPLQYCDLSNEKALPRLNMVDPIYVESSAPFNKYMNDLVQTGRAIGCRRVAYALVELHDLMSLPHSFIEMHPCRLVEHAFRTGDLKLVNFITGALNDFIAVTHATWWKRWFLIAVKYNHVHLLAAFSDHLTTLLRDYEAFGKDLLIKAARHGSIRCLFDLADTYLLDLASVTINASHPYASVKYVLHGSKSLIVDDPTTHRLSLVDIATVHHHLACADWLRGCSVPSTMFPSKSAATLLTH